MFMHLNAKVFTILAISSLSTTVVATELEQHKAAAAETTKAFVQQLGVAMKQEMKTNGPVAAVKVCSELAPQMTSQISRDKGWKVTRVGTRVRNPMLGMPDAWEQQVLIKFQQRLQQGEALKPMTHSEIVVEPDGRYFRFMKAIPVGQPCLTCHGSDDNIPAPVQAILKQHYPHDQATGYQAGDLRGAVSIKHKL